LHACRANQTLQLQNFIFIADPTVWTAVALIGERMGADLKRLALHQGPVQTILAHTQQSCLEQAFCGLAAEVKL
jgi:hypothetical protein